MKLKEYIKQYYENLNSSKFLDLNILYFELLYQKFQINKESTLTLADSVNRSNVFPYAIATQEIKKNLPLTNYSDLENQSISNSKDINLCICKMQAGLGSNVKRDDLLEKYSKRKTMGAKGTDLFISYLGKMLSIAEVQLIMAIENSEVYHKVSYVNMVNEETLEAVIGVWNRVHPELNIIYKDLFTTNNRAYYPEIFQMMMPTLEFKSLNFTFDRKAPAGHGFLGFYKIVEILRAKTVEDEVFVIGNGEDLKSTPDQKIISWVMENDIPIVMMTTTKLEKDKKGGQLAIVMEESPYITIVEKAQAERAGQLEYFEQLGLREGDDISLFNTNIVIINQKALKSLFNKYLDISEEEFLENITPELIKNIKIQNQEKYIQLEGALGSVILNLDKLFRRLYGQHVVHFLNLEPKFREHFFLPIKNREDFDEIYG